MLAAYHTTAVVMTWTIFELTQHPEIQRKVQQEIDSTLNGALPNFENLDKFPYLMQVIKESMRVHTPGPFAARILEEDLEIGGYFFESGSTLFYPICAIHKNEMYWDNPDAFDPERFSQQNVKKMNPLAFCPFGMGPRICPGERLSWMEMRMLLTILLQRFNFELAMPVEEVQECERFVMMAKNDILVRLTRR